MAKFIVSKSLKVIQEQWKEESIFLNEITEFNRRVTYTFDDIRKNHYSVTHFLSGIDKKDISFIH